MRIKKYYISLILLLLTATTVSSATTADIDKGQEKERTEMRIYFRVNSSVFNSEYRNNKENINQITAFLDSLRNDSTVRIESVTFQGSTSPEGRSDLNRALSAKRLATLENMIRSRVELSDSIILRESEYVPWDYLVARLETSNLSHKDEAVNIIKTTPLSSIKNERLVDSRLKHLMDLNYGRTWHEMNRLYFDEMRNACAVFITFKKKEQPILQDVEIDIPHVAEIEIKDTVLVPIDPTIIEHPKEKRGFTMAVKTNALYDLCLIPNLGVEIPLTDRMSLATNWMYGWWSRPQTNKAWFHRAYGGDLGVRYWLGNRQNRQVLTGHHIGVYGQMLTYDFCFDREGEIADKWSWAAGLEYGFSFPIAKSLNLDFTIGAGYLSGGYSKYTRMDDCSVWQSTHKRHYFGPTKAEISLVWILGKGGAR